MNNNVQKNLVPHEVCTYNTTKQNRSTSSIFPVKMTKKLVFISQLQGNLDDLPNTNHGMELHIYI